jgi:hypothetical protein
LNSQLSENLGDSTLVFERQLKRGYLAKIILGPLFDFAAGEIPNLLETGCDERNLKNRSDEMIRCIRRHDFPRIRLMREWQPGRRQ